MLTFPFSRVGGCMQLVVTYFSEFIQEKRKRVEIAVLFLFWPLGAAYVIMISWFIIPSTGRFKIISRILLQTTFNDKLIINAKKNSRRSA